VLVGMNCGGLGTVLFVHDVAVTALLPLVVKLGVSVVMS
jgi:hypothetical protein